MSLQNSPAEPLPVTGNMKVDAVLALLNSDDPQHLSAHLEQLTQAHAALHQILMDAQNPPLNISES